MTYDKANEKQGVIAILDALGTQSVDKEMREQYINDMDDLLNRIKHFKEDINRHKKNYPTSDTTQKLEQFEDIQFLRFQDTIVLCWSWKTKDDPDNLNDFRTLPEILSLRLKNFFVLGLEKGIKFRGVVSKGEYYLDTENNRILGQAVYDAAKWYEKAKWMGIITTPRLSLDLSDFQDKRTNEQGKNNFGLYFQKYKIPLKNSPSLSLWAVAWPMNYFGWSNHDGERKFQKQPIIKKNEIIKSGKEKFMKDIIKGVNPSGSEEIHINTIEFFDSLIPKLKNE